MDFYGNAIMKYLVTVAAVLALGLAACSSDESTTTPADEPAAGQQATD
jgi:predicted outer membrane protein